MYIVQRKIWQPCSRPYLSFSIEKELRHSVSFCVLLTVGRFASMRNGEFRVARWFVFKPKIPILVKFGGPWNIKCCDILCQFGVIYSLLVLVPSLWSFGILFSDLVCLDQEKSGNPVGDQIIKGCLADSTINKRKFAQLPDP
jgi:hypothetical protein